MGMFINASIKQAEGLVSTIRKARDLFYDYKRELIGDSESEVRFRAETMWHLMIIALNDARELLQTWELEKRQQEEKERESDE